jgi:hypothetical protein
MTTAAALTEVAPCRIGLVNAALTVAQAQQGQPHDTLGRLLGHALTGLVTGYRDGS